MSALTFCARMPIFRTPCSGVARVKRKPVPSFRLDLVSRRAWRADRDAGAGVAGGQSRAERVDRGAYGIGQDAFRLSSRHRFAGATGARRRAAGRNPDRLRLAAQGAVERHPAQSRRAAGRHSRRARQPGAARRRNPRLGAHRRYAFERTQQDAPPSAAYRRHDAGIALHPARLGIRAQNAVDDAHGHRRRDPRSGAQQARRAPRAFAGAAGKPLRRQAAANRPLGDAKADRDGGQVSGRRRNRRMRDHRRRPHPRARSRVGSSGLAARSGDVERSLVRGLRSDRGVGARASHHAGVRQHAPDGRAGRAAIVGSPRRGRRHRASRQHGEGIAPRRRAKIEARAR